MRRRKTVPPVRDNSYYARGWVEGVLPGEMIEGLFCSDGVFDQFGGLQLIANGEASLCPWSDLQLVTMKPRDELPDAMVRLHHDNVFSMSNDPNVFVGWLPDFQGTPGRNPFVLTPVGDRTWRQWQHLFRRARVLDEDKPEE